MNIEKYQTLTGTTVSDADNARVTAVINRTRAMLETMLGFTLDPKKVETNLYNELGKTQQECACPDVDTQNLNDPDDVVGAYRLYTFNDLDQFFHVDPFTKINAVKLVYVKMGEEPNGVTLRDYTDDQIRVHMGPNGVSKYLERCQTCLCECTCTNCVQLAVDADWIFDSCLPADLNYVWADMITYYSDQKSNIKSESIDTHSYTKFSDTAPEMLQSNLDVIKLYAGPNGSVSVMPTNGVGYR